MAGVYKLLGACCHPISNHADHHIIWNHTYVGGG